MLITAKLNTLIQMASTWIWGWPLVIGIISAAIFLTIALYGIQFRYFFTAWRYVLSPEKSNMVGDYITPFQAFINTLSASIGNGSAAGMATAMYSGGPGAAFWIFILGFFNMAVRFAEVYASTLFIEKTSAGTMRGGPMVFLRMVPGGSFLPTLYAFFGLLASFVAGSAMQCNSMAVGIHRITGANTMLLGLLFFFLLIYAMSGGAQRIIKISDRVIPVKVALFFIATLIVLGHHAAMIPHALGIIMAHAFTWRAVAGGIAGHTIQNALRFGISRSLSATEAGLGTAGVLYGSTASKDPLRSGIMSMASIVTSNHLVCCTLLLLFVASGVWNSGLTSTALTCAAYETVFGTWGALLVTFLSITFGLGVLIAYAYIGRECWNYLTNGKFFGLYSAIYCAMAFFGAWAHVDLVWNAVDIANAGMLIINMYGIIMLTPKLRRALRGRL